MACTLLLHHAQLHGTQVHSFDL
eukprot:SAG22_NODE_12729_length_431_cov_1.204819_1_plen_22_part_01